jgi:hypothetical protein
MSMSNLSIAVLIIMLFQCAFLYIVYIEDLFSMSAVSVHLNIIITEFFEQILRLEIMEFIKMIFIQFILKLELKH